MQGHNPVSREFSAKDRWRRVNRLHRGITNRRRASKICLPIVINYSSISLGIHSVLKGQHVLPSAFLNIYTYPIVIEYAYSIHSFLKGQQGAAFPILIEYTDYQYAFTNFGSSMLSLLQRHHYWRASKICLPIYLPITTNTPRSNWGASKAITQFLGIFRRRIDGDG